MVPALPLPVLFMLVAAALVGAFAAGASAWKLSRTLRRMQDAPPTRVADARAGLVEVNGTIHPAQEPIQAPLTQRACVYWRFQVQQKKTQAVNVGGRPSWRTQWVSLVDDRAHVPCLLRDESGQVALDLAGAQMVLTSTVHTLSGPFRDVPLDLERLMKDRYGKSTRGLWFTRNLRFTETLLTAGTQVFVLGRAFESLGAAKIGAGEDVFLVSDRRSTELVRRFEWQRALAVAGAVISTLGALILATSPWWAPS